MDKVLDDEYTRGNVAARKECAAMLGLSRDAAQLMAGEMTAQEWRTLKAVLVSLQKRMRSEL